MLVKVLGKKLKMCRLYETDLFGNLTIRPKKTQKFLNIVFLEKLKRNRLYKKLRKTIKRFLKNYRRFLVFRINTLKRYYKFKRFNNSFKISHLIYWFIKKDYYSKFFFTNFVKYLKKYLRIYTKIRRRKIKYYNFKKYIQVLFSDYNEDLYKFQKILTLKKQISIIFYKKLNLFFFNIKRFFLFKKKRFYNYYLNLNLFESAEIHGSEIYHYFSDEEVEEYIQNKENDCLSLNYNFIFFEKTLIFHSEVLFNFLLDRLCSTKNSLLISIFSILNFNKITLNFKTNSFLYLDLFIYKINKNLNTKITRNFIKSIITNKTFYIYKSIYKYIKKKNGKKKKILLKRYKTNVYSYSNLSKIKNNKKKHIYKTLKILKIPKIVNFFEISSILFPFYTFYLLKFKLNKYNFKKKVLINYSKKNKKIKGAPKIKENNLYYLFFKKKLKNHILNFKTRASLNRSLIKKKKIITSLISHNKNFYSFFFNNNVIIKSFYYYNFWFLRFFYKYNLSYYRKKLKKRFLTFSNKKKRKPKFNYRIDVGKPARKRKKKTPYWHLLLTRHRLRYFASKISVHQLKLYIKNYRGSKFFGMHFLWLLESRIDFILYRLNLQISAYHARQYIKHVGVFVNEKYVNVSSYKIKFNSILTFVNKTDSFKFLLFKFFKKIIIMSIPYYIEINHRIMSLRFFFKPRYNTIFYPFNINSNKLAALGERFK